MAATQVHSVQASRSPRDLPGRTHRITCCNSCYPGCNATLLATHSKREPQSQQTSRDTHVLPATSTILATMMDPPDANLETPGYTFRYADTPNAKVAPAIRNSQRHTGGSGNGTALNDGSIR